MYRRRTGHAVRPRNTADQRSNGFDILLGLDCKKGQIPIGYQNLTFLIVALNYTTGASASPLSRCFVATILLHMLPSWTGCCSEREVGKLSQLVTGFPTFSTHNPWGCPRNALLAPLTSWGISPVL